MTMRTESTTVLSPDEKRAVYGDGPWCAEPDRIEWRARGSRYPCLMLRHPDMGHWCGYVGVPPGHSLYRTPHGRVDLAAHGGGVNFAARCSGVICHVPRAG